MTGPSTVTQTFVWINKYEVTEILESVSEPNTLFGCIMPKTQTASFRFYSEFVRLSSSFELVTLITLIRSELKLSPLSARVPDWFKKIAFFVTSTFVSTTDYAHTFWVD